MAGIRPLPVESLRRAATRRARVRHHRRACRSRRPRSVRTRADEALAFAIGMRREGYNVLCSARRGRQAHACRAVLAVRPRSRYPKTGATSTTSTTPSGRARCACPPGAAPELRRPWRRSSRSLHARHPRGVRERGVQPRVQASTPSSSERHEKAFSELASRPAHAADRPAAHPIGFAVAPVKDGEVIDARGLRASSPRPSSSGSRGHPVAAGDARNDPARGPARPRKRSPRGDQGPEPGGRPLGVTGHLVDELSSRYDALPKVVAYLDAVGPDVVENVHELPRRTPPPARRPRRCDAGGRWRPSRRYRINVLVDHGDRPARRSSTRITRPSQPRRSHRARDAVRRAPHRLHADQRRRAAPGERRLPDPRRASRAAAALAWEALKRTLHSGQIRIESLGRCSASSGRCRSSPSPCRST